MKEVNTFSMLLSFFSCSFPNPSGGMMDLQMIVREKIELNASSQMLADFDMVPHSVLKFVHCLTDSHWIGDLLGMSLASKRN